MSISKKNSSITWGIKGQLNSNQSIESRTGLLAIQNFYDALNGNRSPVEMTRSSRRTYEILSGFGVNLGDNAPAELAKGNAVHIKNRHMSSSSDMKPLSDVDIASIPYVIRNPDSGRLGRKVRGAQRYLLETAMGNNYIAIVEVPPKGDVLKIISFFIRFPRGGFTKVLSEKHENYIRRL